MGFLGPNELTENVIQKNLCIGCGACMNLCPYFRSYRCKTAMLFPCTVSEGRCASFCPKIEVDLDYLSKQYFGNLFGASSLGHNISIMISQKGKKIKNHTFQAGGTVSALISFALKKKYISSAILTDREGLLPIPRIITKDEDVFKCASTKYAAAPTLSALNTAIGKGHSQIGVVGTPCQTTAIAQMRTTQSTNKDPVGMVIGLFCTWALDYTQLEPFISQQIETNKILKFDILPPPAEIMEIYTTDGKKHEISLDKIRKFIPATCSYCADMTSEFSDISVGVLEGYPDKNTLIIRSEKGKMLVDEAEKEGYIIVDEIPEKSLEHLKTAARQKRKRALLKAKEDGLLNATEDGKFSCIKLNSLSIEKITA